MVTWLDASTVAAAPDPLRPIAGEGVAVAIVGFGPTRSIAPWNDPAWGELWICNRLGLQPDVPRWTRHFDPHPIAWIEQHFGVLQGKPELWEEYRGWLAKDHGDDRLIYLLEPSPWAPNAVLFPVRELVEFFGRPYFTSTIAYQIGLAILLGAKRIGLWGIDFRSDTEYGFERPCAEWLLGIAQGRGIEIVLPDQAAVLNNGGVEPLYGAAELDTPLADFEKIFTERVRECDELIGKLGKRNDELLREMYIGEGAKQQTLVYLNMVREARRGGPLRFRKTE